MKIVRQRKGRQFYERERETERETERESERQTDRDTERDRDRQRQRGRQRQRERAKETDRQTEGGGWVQLTNPSNELTDGVDADRMHVNLSKMSVSM